MEIRQRKMESQFKLCMEKVKRLEKSIAIQNEFLDLQFDSYMDFFLQKGGEIIQVPGENGKDPQTGLFIPFNGRSESRDDLSRDHNGDENGDEVGSEHDGHDPNDEDPLIYAPPQAILGNSPEQEQPLNYVNGHQSPVNLSSYHNNDSLKQEGSEDGDPTDRHHEVGNSSEDEAAEDMRHHINGQQGHHQNGDSEEGEEEDENDDINPYSNLQYLDQQSIQRFPFAHFLDAEETPHQMNGDQSSSDGTENSHMQTSLFNNYSTSGPRRRTSSATPVENQHICRYCGKIFHWKQSWVIHERTHTGEKPYSCACGKAFSQKANMNTHAKQCKQAKAVHNGKTNIFEMKCSLCPKMFTSKKALDSHKLKSHPGSLTSMISNNNNLRQLAANSSTSSRNFNINSIDHGQGGHTNTHHNASSNNNQTMTRASLLRMKPNTHLHQQQEISNTPENLIERTLASLTSKLMGGVSVSAIKGGGGVGTGSNSSSSSCSSGVGGGNFISSSSGILPPGSHPPGKSKHCRWCDKFFSRKTSLKIHERVHTGERPYACGYCGKTFTQKGSVKLHCQRVHNANYNIAN